MDQKVIQICQINQSIIGCTALGRRLYEGKNCRTCTTIAVHLAMLRKMKTKHSLMGETFSNRD